MIKRMASGDLTRDIVGYEKTMASGDPLSEIIGDFIGEDDIIDDVSITDDEVGFSLNPVKAFNRIADKAKAVKRATVDKVPVVREVAAFTTQRANLIYTPYRTAGGFIKGVATGGGLKGGIAGAKHEAIDVTKREAKRFIQNPVVRYGSKGAAVIFPPLTPVAVGVEAANLTIQAVEQKDKKKALQALEMVANTAAAANAGDEDAMRTIKTLKAVKDGTLTAAKVAKHIKDDEPMKALKLGARFTIPKGATAGKVAVAADKLLSVAKDGKGAKATAAMSIIKQTIAAAKAGDPAAKKGAVALAKVNAAQKRAGKGAFGMALRASKGKRYSGYFVDKNGKVLKGQFTAV
jgi:hypothetical protein